LCTREFSTVAGVVSRSSFENGGEGALRHAQGQTRFTARIPGQSGARNGHGSTFVDGDRRSAAMGCGIGRKRCMGLS
jgi:hypothetical protein